jgi:hypothetical protein
MNAWRDSLTIHPLADSFPMMSDGELKELAEDIKRNGQRDPVIFATTGGTKVLVGGRWVASRSALLREFGADA